MWWRTVGVAILAVVALGSPTARADREPPLIAAAGDIACDPETDPNFGLPNGPKPYCQMGATADRIGPAVDRVLVLGDLQYENGTLEKFQASYDPTWGRLKDRTAPVPGNHEYRTPDAQGYFDYFGTAAHARNNGYYSYDLGSWHIVALNSNCGDLPPAPGTNNGCAEGSPQEVWLRDDLAADRRTCTLAYWHHPRFSSEEPTTQVGALFTALYDDGAEVVLSGHAHNYERFAPQNPDGIADWARGIVQFVVGTGGKNLRPFDLPPVYSIVRNDAAFGVLKMTLRRGAYDFEFFSTDDSFTDSGSRSCH